MSKENTEFDKTLISNKNSNSVSVSLSAHKHEYRAILCDRSSVLGVEKQVVILSNRTILLDQSPKIDLMMY